MQQEFQQEIQEYIKEYLRFCDLNGTYDVLEKELKEKVSEPTIVVSHCQKTKKFRTEIGSIV